MADVKKQIEKLESQGYVCRVEGEEVVCETNVNLPSMKVGTTIRIPKRELEKMTV